MVTYDRGDLAFLPIRPNDDFAKRLAAHFNIRDPDDLVVNTRFSNGEYCPTITDVLQRNKTGPKRLEGRRACIVTSYTSEVNNTESLARILLLSDAAYRAGATEVYLAMAESLFDRQDMDPNLMFDDSYETFSGGKKRKLEKLQGQPHSLEVTIRLFQAAGIKKVLTLDRHSEASEKIYGEIYRCDPKNVFFNLDPVPIFINYLLRSGINGGKKGENLVILAPDKGAKKAVERMYELSGLTDASLMFCNKYRQVANDAKRIEAAVEKTSENFKGIEGKIVVGLDDKGDTLGTLNKTLVEGLGKYGTPKQIHALLSHMIFSSRTPY